MTSHAAPSQQPAPQTLAPDRRKPARWEWARLWHLALVLLAAGLYLGWLWLVSDWTISWRVVYTLAAAAALAGVVSLWFAFWPALPAARRAKILAVEVLAVAVAVVLLRVESVDGNLWPRFGWRFAAKPHQGLAIPPPASANSDDQSAEAPLQAGPDDFVQFLGPQRRNVIDNVRLAAPWTAGQMPQTLWKQPIGAGWSSFALVGDYAFTMEQRGARELVVAYRIADGSVAWSHAEDNEFASVVAGDGPRATPTFHEGRLYAAGATGRLHAFDARSGRRLWSRDVLGEHGAAVPQWGYAASPLIAEGLVIVPAGAPGAALAAYRADDGLPAWTGGDDIASYASPTLATLGGQTQVVQVHGNTIAGYALHDGRRLWQRDWTLGAAAVSQPLPIDPQHLFVSAGYGIGSALWKLTESADGTWQTEVVWQNRHLKTKFNNVARRDGFVYGLDEGILVCLSLADGRRQWKEGRYGHGQLMRVGEHLLVLAEDGSLALLEANPQQRVELGRFPVFDDKTWNSLALRGDRLLIRNDREMACVRLPLRKEGAP